MSLLVSCEKDDSPIESKEQIKHKSHLLVSKSASTSKPENQDDFTIEYAGVYQDMLYLGLIYQGGEKAHEFQVNWDGKKKKEGQKEIIELSVAHLTTGDKGTESVVDSLTAKLGDLKITEEDLKNDNLWFKVINSSNPSNSLIFQKGNQVVNDTGDGSQSVPSLYEMNATVVEVSCSSEGVWGNLWLKAENDNYCVVKEVDKSINYSPAKDDKLRLKYEYNYLDSLNVCDQVKELGAYAITIKELEKKD